MTPHETKLQYVKIALMLVGIVVVLYLSTK